MLWLRAVQKVVDIHEIGYVAAFLAFPKSISLHGEIIAANGSTPEVFFRWDCFSRCGSPLCRQRAWRNGPGGVRAPGHCWARASPRTGWPGNP